MTVAQLNERDRRIAELEAIPRHRRTAAEQNELTVALRRRDHQWRTLAARIENVRRIARELEGYAAQIGMPLERTA